MMPRYAKDLLIQEKYNFIHSHKELGKNIIYLTLSGSIGYGTNLDGSDIDLRGVTIERRENTLGFGMFEQFEELETDTVIYGLKKFASLALKGNPNILEMLGTREEHVIYTSKHGELLRENREMFLSKRVVNTFGNYATAQLRRLQNALARDHYPEEEKEKHILATLNRSMLHFEESYVGFSKGSMNLYIDQSNKEERETELYMDIHIDGFPLRDFTGIYSEMSNIIRDYDKLNHRNRKKSDQKLYKHAMHLIRLLIMGTDILLTHRIVTYRTEEHELLMDIRNGKIQNSELFQLIAHWEERFREAAEVTTLPEMPDEEFVQRLLMSMYEEHYYGPGR